MKIIPIVEYSSKICGAEMQFNMEAEKSNNGGSEQASTSDDGQFLLAFRKMMKKEVEVMVIRTVEQVIVPIIGGLVRTVVKEEIQSVEKWLLARNTNEVTTSKERQLQLKLSDKVSSPVLTGKLLKGKKDNPLKVELVDRETGRVVENEPISFAKVEILVLDASRNDNWSVENFNSRIIRVGDKKRPHFSKNVYIDLKGGVGFLSDVKLGHDSKWMKNCKCRLGARMEESVRGVNVQEGWTGSFMVKDSRSKQYEKHYPPSLSDKVWRLENIGRNGARCKRLNEGNVETVEDFLFLLSADRHELQNLVGAGANWKDIVDHALTCPKDDKLSLYYNPSTESKMGVIFDTLGGLKGIIDDSHYVPIDDLSCDEKDSARKLLVSPFKNREARKPSFDDEAALLKQFPYRWNVINSPIHEGSNGNCLSVSDYIYSPVELGITTLDRANCFGFVASTDTGQINSPIFSDVPFPDPGTNNPNNMLPLGSPELPYLCAQSPSYEAFINNWSLISPINNLSEIQPLPHRYRFVTVVKAKVWVLRAKKRITALGGIQPHKKQKTSGF